MDPADEYPGQVETGIGCSQDIPNSILTRAGLAPSAGMLGEDLNKIMSGGETSRRDGVVVEQATSLPLPGRIFYAGSKPLSISTGGCLTTPARRGGAI